MIEDGINGFLTEPGDVSAIAEKMEKLLSDDSLRIATGEAARKKVNEAFKVDANCANLIHAWEEIIVNQDKRPVSSPKSERFSPVCR